MANLRVTQAGRQAATQEDAAVRVTKAGRSVALVEDAAVRVTKAGRNVAIQSSASARITQLGRNILVPLLAPNTPVVTSPNGSDVYALDILIAYEESVDPLGGTITYTAEYRPNSGGAWVSIFTGRTGNDPYVWDVSGLADADYDIQVWATATGGTNENSTPSTVLGFTVDNTSPSAPVITEPLPGEEWAPINPQRVEWDAAVDPNGLSLTYKLDYRAVGAGSWTGVTTGVTDLFYDWDVSAFPADDYEVRVYANNGTADGPADEQLFSITTADRPTTPSIRIIAVGISEATVQLTEYEHPTPRDWQATKFELIPFGGDWTNPVRVYTTTDVAEQREYTFEGLPPGFRGIVRGSYQDNASNWSLVSPEATFVIPSQTADWEKRWERNHDWTMEGLGIRGVSGDWGAGYNPQPISGLVDPSGEFIGSYRVSAYMMAGGCYCGFGGVDTELTTGGIAVMLGNSETGNEYGVFFGLDFGTKNSAATGVPGSHRAKPFAYVQSPDCATQTKYGTQFNAYSQVVSGVTSSYGQSVGPWVSPYSHTPIYRLELWVQRNLSTQTSRVRGRIRYVGYASPGFPAVDEKSYAEDAWDIDFTTTCLTICGLPGYWRRQLGNAWASSFMEFYGLTYTALRDEGLEFAENRDPLTPFTELVPDTCTPQAEDPLPEPVFFPLPPNGNMTEGWVHPSNLIIARDDTEQRVSLRERPVERISFPVTVVGSREVSHLRSLIWSNQAGRWAVPMWMDSAELEVDLSSSSVTIPAGSVDTASRRFEEMEYLALWVDQFTWELFEATLNADGSITLNGSTAQTFQAWKTKVIPCRVGRMGEEVEVDHLSPSLGDLEFTFVLEATENG